MGIHSRMRKPLLPVTALLSLFTLITAFTPAGNKPEKILKKQGFTLIPSGATIVDGKDVTVQSFFVSTSEITNAQYTAFLDALKAQGRDADLQIAAVQNEKWKLPNSDMKAYAEQYFSHPAYAGYPVVNISQQAAKMYCAWLEQQLQKQGLQVKVRLPEKTEWVMAARGGHAGNIYAWNGHALRNKRGVYMANFKTEHLADDGSYIIAPSRSYFPNDYKLYNMSGNVSEWLSTTGICIGGNWWSPEEFIRIDAAPEFPMSGDASPFIGFRPVITAAW